MASLMGSFLGAAQLCNAGDFNGHLIRLVIRVQNNGIDVDPPSDQGAVFVGPAVEYPSLVDSGGGPYATIPVAIDLTNTTISFNFSQLGSGTFATAGFNGYVFSDAGGTLPAITGVSVDTNGTTLAINNSRLSFTADEIRVNVQGLGFNSSTFARIKVKFAPTSPTLNIRTAQSGSQLELYWQTETNALYQLEYRAAIGSGSWAPLFTNWVPGTGGIFSTNDTAYSYQARRFYRLAVTNSLP